MPKLYRCKHPGCGSLVESRGAYCMDHGHYAAEEQRKREEYRARSGRYAMSPNDHLYNSSRWRSLSKRVREAAHCCTLCRSQDNLQVHHITPPRGNEELFFDENNLAVVCHSCHERITRQEMKARRERK